MPSERMRRAEFFGHLGALDRKGLEVAIWNLYRRGSAELRARVEAEIIPGAPAPDASSTEAVDPAELLAEVRDFVSLARAGAYLGRDRRVSPKERTRWRFTFRRLATSAQQVLAHADLDAAAVASLEALVDLACELRSYDYFRSEDPVEVAAFVVSDAVAQLWTAQRDRHGFAAFAERAAPQLERWESEYGWTRRGFGRVADQETTLATVVSSMLPAQDMWESFADRYLDALDALVAPDPSERGARRGGGSVGHDRRRRAADLAEWHLMLVDRLVGDDTEGRIDRLVEHPALGGPDLTYLQAQVAHRRGDIDRARQLLRTSLKQLPGHEDYLAFAKEIGLPDDTRG